MRSPEAACTARIESRMSLRTPATPWTVCSATVSYELVGGRFTHKLYFPGSGPGGAGAAPGRFSANQRRRESTRST